MYAANLSSWEKMRIALSRQGVETFCEIKFAQTNCKIAKHNRVATAIKNIQCVIYNSRAVSDGRELSHFYMSEKVGRFTK